MRDRRYQSTEFTPVLLAVIMLALVIVMVWGCAGTTDQEGWSGIKTPFLKPVTVVTYPVGEFSLAYADIKSAYVLLAANVVAACKAQLLTPETCHELEVAKARIETIDSVARNSIRSPGATVDWQAVGEAIRMITSLAISLGVPGGGAIVQIPKVLDKAGPVLQQLNK